MTFRQREVGRERSLLKPHPRVPNNSANRHLPSLPIAGTPLGRPFCHGADNAARLNGAPGPNGGGTACTDRRALVAPCIPHSEVTQEFRLRFLSLRSVPNCSLQLASSTSVPPPCLRGVCVCFCLPLSQALFPFSSARCHLLSRRSHHVVTLPNQVRKGWYDSELSR